MEKIRQTSENFFSKAKRVFYFITRSLLISVLCLMIFFGIVVFCYVGDLLIHVKSDNYTSPLFSAYVIVSPSMVPTISVNDAIVIKRLDHDKYDVGDIITFQSKDANYEGYTITHRVVKKETIKGEESLYTTKGDNNNVIDANKVETSSIYGKVLLKIPKIGYIKTFFSHPSNFFITFIIPVIIIIIYDLGRIFYMLNQKEEII